jgi:hypothetical protein
MILERPRRIPLAGAVFISVVIIREFPVLRSAVTKHWSLAWLLSERSRHQLASKLVWSVENGPEQTNIGIRLFEVMPDFAEMRPNRRD